MYSSVANGLSLNTDSLQTANVSSKGKQYILFKDNLKFENYLINVSKFYYSKIIK